MQSLTPRHHVIITGTGRAGTTFLMELLTNLGLDTGFNSGNLTALRMRSHGQALKRTSETPIAAILLKIQASATTQKRCFLGMTSLLTMFLYPCETLSPPQRADVL